MNAPKPNSAPLSLLIFVPYRPPSPNRTTSGKLRERIRHKQDARAAWLSASLPYADALLTLTTTLRASKPFKTPSRKRSASTTGIPASPGSISKCTPLDAKA